MRKTFLLLLLLPGLLFQSVLADGHARPVLESLLRQSIAADGYEVIVSRVTLPANAELPTHWHPGEEFAYVLAGEMTLILDGEHAGTSGPGEVVAIPERAVHAGISGPEGATILVFRVHVEGQPERVLVESEGQ